MREKLSTGADQIVTSLARSLGSASLYGPKACSEAAAYLTNHRYHFSARPEHDPVIKEFIKMLKRVQ